MQTAILQAFYSMHLYNNVCMYVCVCVCLSVCVYVCLPVSMCVVYGVPEYTVVEEISSH